MKTIETPKQRHELPKELNEKLNELIENDEIHFIFHSNDNLLDLSTLTIVLQEHFSFKKLLKKKWVSKSVERFKLHIHFINMQSFYQSDSFQNNIYASMNCQSIHLVYGSEKECKPLFISDFSKKHQNKVLNSIDIWFQSEHQRQSMFLKILEKDYNNDKLLCNEAPLQYLKTVLLEIQNRIQSIIKPNNIVDTKEFMNHLFFHCKAVKKGLENVENLNILKSILDFQIDQNLVSKETRNPLNIKNLITLTLKLVDTIYLDLANDILTKYKEVSLTCETAILKQQQAIVQKNLETKTKEILKNYVGLESVYLLKRKNSQISSSQKISEFKVELLLLVTVDRNTLEMEGNLRQKVILETDNKVEATFILLKKNNWQKHLPVYGVFLHKHLKKEQHWIGNPLVPELSLSETIPLDQLKSKFWIECKSVVNPIIQRNKLLGVNNGSVLDYGLYKGLFQQLLIAILFSKANFIPQVFSVKYIWRLIEWYVPEILDKIYLNERTSSILLGSYNIIRNHPTMIPYKFNNVEEEWKDLQAICETLLDYANSCYQNIPVFQVTPAIITPTFSESENTNQVEPII